MKWILALALSLETGSAFADNRTKVDELPLIVGQEPARAVPVAAAARCCSGWCSMRS
jgi:hypothetical protein